MERADGRRADELRPINLHHDFVSSAPGSVLFEMGNTRVLCVATLQPEVPPFLRNKGRGWLTCEYSMLPRSSPERVARESVRGRQQGRTQEIQRLIGRSLRTIVNFKKLGERTLLVDCDVIQADGGTRCASVTGGCIAVHRLIRHLLADNLLADDPLTGFVAAVSAGIVDGAPVLDLCFTEDSRAEVDMNVVMTGEGRIVELQGTAEGQPFSKPDLDALFALASAGVGKLVELQKSEVVKPNGR